MKIKFDLSDEITITNQTVKVTAMITGVVGKSDRKALEDKANELAKKLFPDADWAFSNFRYSGFTFTVNATTRIDSAQNDQLEVRADEISDATDLAIQILDLDTSIPLHQSREAESDLRVALIEKAKAEAVKLGGTVSDVVFGQPRAQAIARGAMMAAASYMESAKGPAGVMGDAGPAGGAGLGHSEKITMSANILVDTTKQVL